MAGSGPPDLPDRVDVLVAGSGAAGLTAALTAAVSGSSVLVVEAAERFGGTSALSGGRVWIPPSRGHDDSPEAAVDYLAAVFGRQSLTMVETFVHTSRQMAGFVAEHSPHRFVVCPRYPDYQPDLPGWSGGGRTHDAAPIALGDLTPQASNILLPPGYLPITHEEWEKWRFPDAYDWELIDRRREGHILTNGASLVASLIDGCVRAGVALVAGWELVDVDRASDDEGTRVHLAGAAGSATIVTGSLILATGGFDANPDLRSSLLPAALAVSASAPTNTGIAIRLARDRGHAVDNLSEGWWMPMVQPPGESLFGVPYPRSLVRERGVPHQIAINESGHRFVDEVSPYHLFVKAMLREVDGEHPNQRAWLIFDEQFRAKYAFPGLTPSGPIPDHIETADSLARLAARLGVDPTVLPATVARWNRHCRAGHDPDFSRGGNHYDRYYGDPRLSETPNLGTIERSPFYAAPILSGTIGSKGGPVTTEDGVIIDLQGRPQNGWYAVGNASATWTSDGYPAPGSTLGIAMTFGHRAGMAASGYSKTRKPAHGRT
jgi:3-oxosteroid 1-dehydrogenase